MASVNSVTLVGNLGRDPEIRQTQNGSIANLAVATSESWKDKNTGERKEKTEWHRVVLYDERLVEIAEKYLHKGSKVYLRGSLSTRKWTNQQGVEQHTTEIVLQRFRCELVMLDDNRGGNGAAPAPHAPTPPMRPAVAPPRQPTTYAPAGSSYGAEIDDSIPFISFSAYDEPSVRRMWERVL